ncbi:ATP-binding protein [Streptomyces sp. NPDC050535]|uniref:ATP-binding protein n=1 Tax=Streptomyces sp. NPDC050535 TaxID=3365626 RepID=UPI0037A36A26
MSEAIPEAAFWCLAVGLLAVSVLWVRQRGMTSRQRGRAAELADGLRARDEELRHLVEVRLPALADSPERSPLAVGPLDGRLADTDFAKCLDGVLDSFSGAVERARSRADRSAKARTKASMRSVQALANEQQVSISAMQDRHDDPDVLRGLLEIDHSNAQLSRRAQAVAVLCGSWPGRQREASPLVEVVRGATSRIRDYRRIRIVGEADLAVESRAVEPVVLAVAELLDNAARHSRPGATVEVDIRSTHNGARVIIDDAGVGMDVRATEQAAELLSGRQTVDVTGLGDPPRFGLAVIGVLAARYGFTVSVDTRSPYGGVRAVVFVPDTLLTHLDAATDSNTATDVAKMRESPATVEPARVSPRTAEAVSGGVTTAGGLPRRRRRAPRAAATAEPATGTPSAPEAEETEGRSAAEKARRMGAFARGTRSGRAAQDTSGIPEESPHPDEGKTQG